MHDPQHISSRTAGLWLVCGIAAEVGAVLAAAPLMAAESQLGALELAFPHGALAAFALHFVSALLFGLWAADGEIMSRPAACAAACVLVLTLPVLGALGVCIVIVPAWRVRRPLENDGVLEHALPSFTDAYGGEPHGRKTRPAPAPIEVVLRGQGAARQRVAGVMALRHMEAQRAVPLLRVALGDGHEDVRLLAYALPERREKDLRAGIERLLVELPELTVEAQPELRLKRALVLRRLTEQHWELVHGAFVSGELEEHTLHAAVKYGHESLLLAADGSLALLLARIRLRRADAHSALRYLRAANVLGVATAVLAPLYAEVAFLLRRFHVIEPLLAQAGDAVLARPRLDAVAQFWTGRETA